MLQKKNEGILFSAEIRVVGSYTDRLLIVHFLKFYIRSKVLNIYSLGFFRVWKACMGMVSNCLM